MSVTHPNIELDFEVKSQALNKGNLSKRARSKFLSERLSQTLFDYACEVDSPLKRTYGNSVRCCSKVTIENGKTRSEYCKNRCCIVCSRIKCASDINNYKDSYQEKMINPYFLTLTLRNVDGFALRPKIKQMFKTWDKIRDSYRKKYPSRKVIGFLKLECTYNRRADTYHPHFHFLGEDEHFCKYAKDKWFFHYKNECYKTYQKSIKVTLEYNENGDRNFKELQEIFKYVAKVVSGQNKKEEEDDPIVNAKSLDTIYLAMSRIRCLKFYGLKKKKLSVEEEVEQAEQLESDEAPESAQEQEVFVWQSDNWYSTESGEALTDFEVWKKERNFELMIEKGKIYNRTLTRKLRIMKSLRKAEKPFVSKYF